MNTPSIGTQRKVRLLASLFLIAAAALVQAAPPPPDSPEKPPPKLPPRTPAPEPPPREAPPLVPVLRPVRPTGPAPTNFVIRGTPLIAQLSWDAAPGAGSYQLWRGAGSAYPEQIATNLTATQFSDRVPEAAPVYQYRLVVSYANGTWGEASVNWTSPPLTQPTGFRASMVGKQAVQLMWNPVAGAIRYRLDGAGIPATGLHQEQTSALVYAPVGAQSWQVMTMYPGDVGDFQNRPGVSLMIRALPPHTPRWLTKSNGAGSDGEASYHYRTMFGSGWKDPFWPHTAEINRNDLNSNTFRTAMHGAGYDMNELDGWSGPGGIRYMNTTELGAERATACEQVPGPRTICWTNSHGPFLNGLSLIITDSRGMQFGSFRYLADWHSERTRIWSQLLLASKTATFDSEGPKYLPHVCISCHGGRYDSQSGFVTGATLLPIDPGLVNANVSNNARQYIRNTNAVILRSNPSPAVAAYIRGLYNGTEATGDAIEPFVPAAWSQHRSIYLNIVKPNCAMCHLAQSNLSFMSAGHLLQNKSLVYNSVCGPAKTMPHAEVPFVKFWTQNTGVLFMPGVFANWLGYSNCQ